MCDIVFSEIHVSDARDTVPLRFQNAISWHCSFKISERDVRDGGGAERDLLQGGGLHREGRQGKGHYHHYHFHYYMYYQILESYRNHHYCSSVGL